jgi:hypothetical protein
MEDRSTISDELSGKDIPRSAAGETTSAPPKVLPATLATPQSKTHQPSDAAPKPSTAASPKDFHSLQDAKAEVSKLIRSGKAVSADVAGIQSILKEHISLKEKVDKLKSLLGRSAKAQRETKVDADATHKRMSQVLREIDRLNQKLEKLQSRPTHRKSRCLTTFARRVFGSHIVLPS